LWLLNDWICDKIVVAKLISLNEEVTIMAYVISDECVSCGTCAPECPVDAISEGDGKYNIAEDACVECGTCAGVCPTGAIKEP